MSKTNRVCYIKLEALRLVQGDQSIAAVQDTRNSRTNCTTGSKPIRKTSSRDSRAKVLDGNQPATCRAGADEDGTLMESSPASDPIAMSFSCTDAYTRRQHVAFEADAITTNLKCMAHKSRFCCRSFLSISSREDPHPERLFRHFVYCAASLDHQHDVGNIVVSGIAVNAGWILNRHYEFVRCELMNDSLMKTFGPSESLLQSTSLDRITLRNAIDPQCVG